MKSDMQKLIELENKRISYKLSKKEQDEFNRLNSKISGIPLKYFTKESSDKLDDIIKKTDDLLNKL